MWFWLKKLKEVLHNGPYILVFKKVEGVKKKYPLLVVLKPLGCVSYFLYTISNAKSFDSKQGIYYTVNSLGSIQTNCQ